jgi:hypothetical protein
MPSPHYEKTGPRAEHHQGGDDLGRPLVAVRIEDAGHVVVEETAGPRRPPGALAGPVLDPGQRARQARGHDEHQPGGRDDLDPQQPGPPPRGEAAENAQRQKPEMGGDGDERDGFEEHGFTVRVGVSRGRSGDTGP